MENWAYVKWSAQPVTPSRARLLARKKFHQTEIRRGKKHNSVDLNSTNESTRYLFQQHYDNKTGGLGIIQPKRLKNSNQSEFIIDSVWSDQPLLIWFIIALSKVLSSQKISKIQWKISRLFCLKGCTSNDRRQPPSFNWKNYSLRLQMFTLGKSRPDNPCLD